MSWLDFVAERSSIKQFRKVKSEKVLNIFINVLDYLEYTLITNSFINKGLDLCTFMH